MVTGTFSSLSDQKRLFYLFVVLVHWSIVVKISYAQYFNLLYQSKSFVNIIGGQLVTEMGVNRSRQHKCTTIQQQELVKNITKPEAPYNVLLVQNN